MQSYGNILLKTEICLLVSKERAERWDGENRVAFTGVFKNEGGWAPLCEMDIYDCLAGLLF